MLDSLAIVNILPDLSKTQDIGQFIGEIYQFSLYVIGVVIFVRFIWAGWLYFAAAGNAGKTGAALEIMRNAVAGAILLFASYLILYVVNPDLTASRSPDLLKDLRAEEPAADSAGTKTGTAAITITELVPKSGKAGTALAIKGKNFPADAVVIFGEETIYEITIADPQTITLRVPADLPPGDYPVDVIVELTGESAEQPAQYRVIP